MRQQVEEDFHLVPVLLDVADVVDDERVEAAQLFQLAGQIQIALGHQQLLHEHVTTTEKDPTVLVDQLLADGTQQMRLAAAGLAEG